MNFWHRWDWDSGWDHPPPSPWMSPHNHPSILPKYGGHVNIIFVAVTASFRLFLSDIFYLFRQQRLEFEFFFVLVCVIDL